MWVARNRDNSLYLFLEKPARRPENSPWPGTWTISRGYKIDEDLFPDVTWSDEPAEVELRGDNEGRALLYAIQKTEERTTKEVMRAACDIYSEILGLDENDPRKNEFQNKLKSRLRLP